MLIDYFSKLNRLAWWWGNILIAGFVISGCGVDSTEESAPKFDAPYSVARYGVIAQGQILSTSNERRNIEQYVISQMMYAIGQLNGIGGAPDMKRTVVKVDKVEQREDGLYLATYHADLFLAWPREQDNAAQHELILPLRADFEGQKSLMDALVANFLDRQCVDWASHDLSIANFWYYYRPEQKSCESRISKAESAGLITRMTMEILPSDENTEGKSPEYAEIWKDGVLTATAIFGKDKAGATRASDEGIAAFIQAYESMVDTYGRPQKSNLKWYQKPGANHPTLELVFDTPAGPLDIHFYLVDELRNPTEGFRQAYAARSAVSDFVSYNGHAALGANIRALASMGQFKAGQYQLFHINGCDTFAYVDHVMRDAHHKLNPDDSPHKYLDIITNAMPSYFTQLARGHMVILRALVEQKKTYRSILSDIDPYQRAVVTGEEDNGAAFRSAW